MGHYALLHAPSTIALHAVWTMVMTVFLAYGILSGVSHFNHFTNWSWALQIIYYGVAFFGHFHLPLKRALLRYVFWLVHGTAVLVFAGILMIMWTNPRIISRNPEIEAGRMNIGQVLIGNEFVHTLPLIAIMMHKSIEAPYLLQFNYGTIQFMHYWGRKTWRRFVFHVFSPVVFLLVWTALFDYRSIYGLDVAPLTVAVGLSVVLLVTNGLIIHLMWYEHYTRLCIMKMHHRLYAGVGDSIETADIEWSASAVSTVGAVSVPGEVGRRGL